MDATLLGMLPSLDLVPVLLGAVCAALLLNLTTALIALRRVRLSARTAAALASELNIYKDAAVTLGQQFDKRPSAQAAPQGERAAVLIASEDLPTNQRAIELARAGASIDDLVAACDVSRTEAGLLLAMARRGRSGLRWMSS